MTLVIEGDLAEVRIYPAGPAFIASVRRLLVTGGRGFLRGAGQSAQVGLGDTVRISLDPLIARRIYTSGSTLTDEEIRAGLDQLRESDEDVENIHRAELLRAIKDGQRYACEQFDLAVDGATDEPERALHRAWEMARKVIGLRRELAAAPVSVVTEAAPAGPAPEKDDDPGDQPPQTLPTGGQ